jgi:RNA polymerase sigma factor (sigma-70 family)
VFGLADRIASAVAWRYYRGGDVCLSFEDIKAAALAGIAAGLPSDNPTKGSLDNFIYTLGKNGAIDYIRFVRSRHRAKNKGRRNTFAVVFTDAARRDRCSDPDPEILDDHPSPYHDPTESLDAGMDIRSAMESLRWLQWRFCGNEYADGQFVQQSAWFVNEDLTPRNREIVRRRYIAGETLKEIGKSFGITSVAAHLVIKHGQAQLRRHLADYAP